MSGPVTTLFCVDYFFPGLLREILNREGDTITPPVAAPSTFVNGEVLERAAPTTGIFNLLNTRTGFGIVGIVGAGALVYGVYYAIVRSPEQVVNIVNAGIAINNDPVIAGFAQNLITANDMMLTINEDTTHITPLEDTARTLAGRLQVNQVFPEENDDRLIRLLNDVIRRGNADRVRIHEGKFRSPTDVTSSFRDPNI